MYYAMMRPEEVIALRVSDCHLPDKGWRLPTLEKATPTAGKAWTDSGTLHDDKEHKQRAEDEIRPIPIPPVLVAALKEHTGGEARSFAMTPDRVDSLLAALPMTSDTPASRSACEARAIRR
jgi:integrase